MQYILSGASLAQQEQNGPIKVAGPTKHHTAMLRFFTNISQASRLSCLPFINNQTSSPRGVTNFSLPAPLPVAVRWLEASQSTWASVHYRRIIQGRGGYSQSRQRTPPSPTVPATMAPLQTCFTGNTANFPLPLPEGIQIKLRAISAKLTT